MLMLMIGVSVSLNKPIQLNTFYEGAFETAPTSVSNIIYPKSLTTGAPGSNSNGIAIACESSIKYFSTRIQCMQLEADDAWGDAIEAFTPVNTSKKAPMPGKTSGPPKPSTGRGSSPRPVTVASRPISDDGWDTSDTTTNQTPKAPPALSMAGMSKEEKAAELARRREERKQAYLFLYS